MHSMGTLLCRDRTPLLKVSGGGELDGIYKKQDELHGERPLYLRIDDKFCIRW